MLDESIEGGRFDLMDGPSEVSQHQDGKLLHILHVQRIPERACHISVPVPCEFFALTAAGVHLDVAGRALLAVVEDLQCACIELEVPSR
jgi:hypothetical protein